LLLLKSSFGRFPHLPRFGCEAALMLGFFIEEKKNTSSVYFDVKTKAFEKF
jgi:hypothetical protein